MENFTAATQVRVLHRGTLRIQYESEKDEEQLLDREIPSRWISPSEDVPAPAEADSMPTSHLNEPQSENQYAGYFDLFN
ncbi:uncharacterized protein FFUJ_11229 [Fusarium fujikuroi IMI 58289]|uniref:Uncharacterized protein n=1 Tax=Gibberella fujikuroi (strain CBS 195.34 / IMI 58289 / NRRL A-6831) TaxID=1279085 RepID=S0EPI7_GIBF5|nr:uncharacterized protein FFUJ_11229 [Fusarium fujikuroi IMI 58289]CCT75188.1 uncharacterized protein FFUJ_11229 [Fusarium fujikuroi IMI 58289]SCO25507.1 uncharacterized protein FFM5_14141 [Fusarium fujikuroi]